MLSSSKELGIQGKVVVVDLPYLIHRSYKAGGKTPKVFPHPDAASSVVPKTIERLKRDLDPAEMHFAIEAGHDHRDQIHPGYKDRKDKEEGLVSEGLRIVRDLVESDSVLYAMGLEADDVMATMAHRHGFDCVIVTADKDLHQLASICHHYHPYDRVVTTEQCVVEKWGVLPRDLGDLLAMAGDKADSIPGISRIGPGIAATLLKEYGGLDQILSIAEDMFKKTKKARWKNIAEQEAEARMSRKLVQLVFDADIETATLNSLDEITNRCSRSPA